MHSIRFAIATVLLVVACQPIRATNNLPIVTDCANNCPEILQPTYGSPNGKTCIWFENKCSLSVENCRRRQSGELALREISKNQCKEFCRDVCTREYKPVCGRWGNALRTFSNLCEFSNFQCRSGRPWKVIAYKTCDTLTCA